MRLVLWAGPDQFETRWVPGRTIPDTADAAAMCEVLNRAGRAFALELGQRAVRHPLPKLFLVGDESDAVRAEILWWELVSYCVHGLIHPAALRMERRHLVAYGATIAEHQERFMCAPV